MEPPGAMEYLFPFPYQKKKNHMVFTIEEYGMNKVMTPL